MTGPSRSRLARAKSLTGTSGSPSRGCVVGAALTLDEVDLVVELDNPYWGSEVLALVQGSLAALGAAVLALRFHRRGSTMLVRSAAHRSSDFDRVPPHATEEARAEAHVADRETRPHERPV